MRWVEMTPGVSTGEMRECISHPGPEWSGYLLTSDGFAVGQVGTMYSEHTVLQGLWKWILHC